VIVGRAVLVSGAAFEATTAVGSERAFVAPSALTAVTRTRMVRPSSAPTSRYVRSVSLRMLTQSLPLAWQRCHWYWNVVGLFCQVPFCAVSVSPTRGVPVIVGGSMLTGATCGDDRRSEHQGTERRGNQKARDPCRASNLCVFRMSLLPVDCCVDNPCFD
jgi:hypothetical protein